MVIGANIIDSGPDEHRSPADRQRGEGKGYDKACFRLVLQKDY
jgi:hypothetical protein